VWWRRGITFVNAVVLAPGGRVCHTLRLEGVRVDGVDVAPQRGDVVVDVDGSIVLPGLINAHDHLELNTLPRLKWRDRHANVREWIADFQPRFGCDARLRALGPENLADRLFVGALKNLLSGVTTVCHHNPVHSALRRNFPVRVVRRFTFSHSLQIDGEALAERHHATPPDRPWVVHAAEGVDEEARAEVPALRRLGCIDRRTVLVHGVGVCPATAASAIEAGAGLVWCPSSNDWLFGATADVRAFDDADRLALGTDSRVSGAGDLLDEMRAAFATRQVSSEGLVRLVTAGAARLFKLRDRGELTIGAAADVTIVRTSGRDPFDTLAAAHRADVRMTIVGGTPAIGVPEMREVFTATGTPVVHATVDGSPRLVARWIGRCAAALAIPERGFEVQAA
jgi:cytosine/adenosine deaminase-related metal-dependent hydrolase